MSAPYYQDDLDLIAEARRLENDYADNYEVMCHMSALADALERRVKGGA